MSLRKANKKEEKKYREKAKKERKQIWRTQIMSAQQTKTF